MHSLHLSIRPLLAAGVLLVARASAQGQTLGTYNFNSVASGSGGTTDPTPPPSHADMTFGAFSANGIGANPVAGGRWAFSGWTTAGLPDAGKYYEVTLTPDPSHTMDLDSITFGVRRSGTGPRDYSVRSSLDGYSSNLPGSVNAGNTELQLNGGNVFHWINDSSPASDVTGTSVNLPSAFDTLTSAVTFRFYGHSAESAGGNFSMDNVAFNGAVAAVPEPEEYAAMFGGGLVVFAMVRRRLKR
jgi:hypothetical protein